LDSGEAKLDITEKMFQKALDQQKSHLSDAFKRGLIAALAYRTTGIKVSLNCPYALGTADFEEFLAGADEGHKSWWAHEEKQKLRRKK
jgi:hypothetical protein